MTEQKLKPCPFCGDEDIRVVKLTWVNGDKEFVMQCMGCGAIKGSIGYNACNGDINKAYNILSEAWNRRTK